MSKNTCSVADCGRTVRARGVCSSHYYRLTKHGDVLAHIPIRDNSAPKLKCSVDGCDATSTRRGYCNKHYIRWRAHGDPLVYRPDKTEWCSVDECERQHYGRGLCRMHYTRWYKHGDANYVSPHFSPFAGRHGDKNYSWVGDDAGYEAVHRRLTVTEGPASSYTCLHCGEGAEHWAYDHEDKDEKVSSRGLAYSTKGRRHYIPLCVSCHSEFDQGQTVWAH